LNIQRPERIPLDHPSYRTRKKGKLGNLWKKNTGNKKHQRMNNGLPKIYGDNVPYHFPEKKTKLVVEF
jgi:hypothetical protein